MAKVTFTLEDKAGQVAMAIDFGPGGTDKSSAAHKTALILSQWMTDLMSMPLEAPKLTLAAEDINAQKAQTIAHLANEPRVIHAHSSYLAD